MVADIELSDEVLEKVPERGARLLSAIGAVSAIRTALAGAGAAEVKARRDALAASDEWHEASFGRFQATLRRHFPAQEEDKRAVDLLAKRGLTKAERLRLRGLIDVALGPTTTLGQAPSTEADDARREALAKLKSWFDERAGHAPAVVKKRVSLIQMGLASRRGPQAKSALEENRRWRLEAPARGRKGARALGEGFRRGPGGFRPRRDASVSRGKRAFVEGVGLGRAVGCAEPAEKGSFFEDGRFGPGTEASGWGGKTAPTPANDAGARAQHELQGRSARARCPDARRSKRRSDRFGDPEERRSPPTGMPWDKGRRGVARKTTPLTVRSFLRVMRG